MSLRARRGNRSRRERTDRVESSLAFVALIVFAAAGMVTGPGWVFAGAAVAFVGLCVRVAQKVGRRRSAALDDLVLRAPGLAPAERQRELDRIISDYGSGVGPAVRKAKAAIHAIPFDHAD